MLGKKKLKLNDEDLYAYAVRLLAGRSLSSGEVREKLRQRAAEGVDLDSVIGKLKEYRFLDDQRFAEGFATSRRDNQSFGQFRVMQDLRKRRVAPGLAKETAQSAFDGVDEVDQATAYLERKYRNKDLPVFLAEQKNAASAYRRLRLAGFGSSASIQVLKRYAREAERLEELETGEGEAL